MVENKNLEETMKETVMEYFKVVNQDLRRAAEENHKEISG
jgi:hypothetical protein